MSKHTDIVKVQDIISNLENVETLALDVASSYLENEVQSIVDKLNELITILKG